MGRPTSEGRLLDRDTHDGYAHARFNGGGWEWNIVELQSLPRIWHDGRDVVYQFQFPSK
jgi:hypothetical protein